MKINLSNRTKWILRFLSRVLVALIAVFITIIFFYASRARSMDDLEMWHRVRLPSEFTAKDLNDKFSFTEYQKMEEDLFDELQEKVYETVVNDGKHKFNRYNSQSLCNPGMYKQNYNRSFELIPADIKGGILLIHGLTDSPYSMKYIAELFYNKGFYVLAMRMPGHGTLPSQLASVNCDDWSAAVKVGARRVNKQTGPDKPFYIAGYSNGALLTLEYAFESINNKKLARPNRLYLFSPSIGVAKVAAMSKWLKTLSFIPYYEKSKWAGISPEYDPFKYASFPLNASGEVYDLSIKVQSQILAHKDDGTIKDLPAIITFQSIADSTVITDAVVNKLYVNLSAGKHELVLFDINRNSYLNNFLNHTTHGFLDDINNRQLAYDFTFITNKSDTSAEVIAITKKQNSKESISTELGLSWPEQVYSLSHIAIMFPIDDSLYGIEPKEDGSLHLGTLEIRGERDLLKIPAEELIRIRCNPFFDYIKQRIEQTIQY